MTTTTTTTNWRMIRHVRFDLIQPSIWITTIVVAIIATASFVWFHRYRYWIRFLAISNKEHKQSPWWLWWLSSVWRLWTNGFQRWWFTLQERIHQRQVERHLRQYPYAQVWGGMNTSTSTATVVTATTTKARKGVRSNVMDDTHRLQSIVATAVTGIFPIQQSIIFVSRTTCYAIWLASRWLGQVLLRCTRHRHLHDSGVVPVVNALRIGIMFCKKVFIFLQQAWVAVCRWVRAIPQRMVQILQTAQHQLTVQVQMYRAQFWSQQQPQHPQQRHQEPSIRMDQLLPTQPPQPNNNVAATSSAPSTTTPFVPPSSLRTNHKNTMHSAFLPPQRTVGFVQRPTLYYFDPDVASTTAATSTLTTTTTTATAINRDKENQMPSPALPLYNATDSSPPLAPISGSAELVLMDPPPQQQQPTLPQTKNVIHSVETRVNPTVNANTGWQSDMIDSTAANNIANPPLLSMQLRNNKKRSHNEDCSMELRRVQARHADFVLSSKTNALLATNDAPLVPLTRAPAWAVMAKEHRRRRSQSSLSSSFETIPWHDDGVTWRRFRPRHRSTHNTTATGTNSVQNISHKRQWQQDQLWNVMNQPWTMSSALDHDNNNGNSNKRTKVDLSTAAQSTDSTTQDSVPIATQTTTVGPPNDSRFVDSTELRENDGMTTTNAGTTGTPLPPLTQSGTAMWHPPSTMVPQPAFSFSSVTENFPLPPGSLDEPLKSMSTAANAPQSAFQFGSTIFQGSNPVSTIMPPPSTATTAPQPAFTFGSTTANTPPPGPVSAPPPPPVNASTITTTAPQQQPAFAYLGGSTATNTPLPPVPITGVPPVHTASTTTTTTAPQPAFSFFGSTNTLPPGPGIVPTAVEATTTTATAPQPTFAFGSTQSSGGGVAVSAPQPTTTMTMKTPAFGGDGGGSGGVGTSIATTAAPSGFMPFHANVANPFQTLGSTATGGAGGIVSSSSSSSSSSNINNNNSASARRLMARHRKR